MILDKNGNVNERFITDENTDRINMSSKLSEGLNDDFDNNTRIGNKMIKVLLDINYDDIRNNLIIEAETIYSYLEIYVNRFFADSDEEFKKDFARAEYLAWMLNNYYGDFLINKFNEALDEENYELCEMMKNVINITEKPNIKE